MFAETAFLLGGAEEISEYPFDVPIGVVFFYDWEYYVIILHTLLVYHYIFWILMIWMYI